MSLCKSVSHKVCDISVASGSCFAFWEDHVAVSVLLGLSSYLQQIGQVLGNHSKLSLVMDNLLIGKGQL